MIRKYLTPENCLKVATALVALVYSAFFFRRLLNNYRMLRANGLDVDLAVPGNPQAMIALCFVMAVLSLFFLRKHGKIVAGLLYLALIIFFGYWMILTSEIKTNIGLSQIPQSTKVGNILIG